MKQLIPMNEFGLMAGTDYVARVNSRKIAEVFGKEHFHVIRDIERLLSDDSGLTEEFRKTNFGLSEYTTEQGHKNKRYTLLSANGHFIKSGLLRRNKAVQNSAHPGES